MTDVFDLIFNFWVGFAVLTIVLVKSSIKFVPQNRAFVVERFGKYNKTMEAGLNFLMPFIDKVAYDRSLKEQAVDVPSQGAITRDNITLVVDGVLYLKVLDPLKASYGVDNYVYAVMQLAQTTMRSEIGKMELAADKTYWNQSAADERGAGRGSWSCWGFSYQYRYAEQFVLPAEIYSLAYSGRKKTR